MRWVDALASTAVALTAQDLHKREAGPMSPWVRHLLLGGAAALLIVIVGLAVAPELFWDRWIYPSYWGPIAADGADAPEGGITEGYNLVSTATYGLILVVAVAGIWELLRRLRLRYGFFFFVAVIPYIVT